MHQACQLQNRYCNVIVWPGRQQMAAFSLPSMYVIFISSMVNRYMLNEMYCNIMKENEDKKYTAVFRAKFQRDVSVQVRLDVSRLGKVKLVQLGQVRLKTRAKIDIQKSPCISCLHLPKYIIFLYMPHHVFLVKLQMLFL